MSKEIYNVFFEVLTATKKKSFQDIQKIRFLMPRGEEKHVCHRYIIEKTS